MKHMLNALLLLCVAALIYCLVGMYEYHKIAQSPIETLESFPHPDFLNGFFDEICIRLYGFKTPINSVTCQLTMYGTWFLICYAILFFFFYIVAVKCRLNRQVASKGLSRTDNAGDGIYGSNKPGRE